MKKILSAIMILLIWVLGILEVIAEDNQPIYKSKLPEVVSYDITLEEIEQDIRDYIEYNKLNVEYASEEYIKLLDEFSFESTHKLTESMTRYYSAYASVYLSSSDVSKNLGKTIKEIRTENINVERNIKKISNQNQDISLVKAMYNVEGAKKYAADYAMVNNYNYPEYGADCTNYASQIIHEGGGLPTTSQWNIWAGTDSLAWMSWVNAGAFCTYWGEVRGKIGNGCTSLAEVNRYAQPGDFIVWRNKDTLEFYHTQFVQSKKNGEIFCSQHSPHYYNIKLNDRHTESSFKGNVVYQLDFT